MIRGLRGDDMNRLRFPFRQFHDSKLSRAALTLAGCVCMALAAVNASAQVANNQTNGFGNNRLVTFTYLQNFDCVDQPTLDLDFNGVLAQSDPNEMQTPICQPVTEPTQDPTGGTLNTPRISMYSFPCFRLTTTRTQMMRCRVPTAEGQLNSAAPLWGPR
jgi:hypothetical protein